MIYDCFNTNCKNEIFAFMAIQAFQFFRRKVLFINRKDNRKC